MHERSTDDFDFDEWAELYRRDPAAFEARRQALLGIELARGTEGQRERGREALARYERAAADRSERERMHVAARYMTAAAEELKDCLTTLGEALPRTDGKP